MGQMDDEFYAGVNDARNNKTPAERNGRIIVRNISFKATKEALKDHFSKFGDIQEVNLLKKPDGKLVGCGFVHFADVAQAEKAIAGTNKKPFLERPIYVAWAVPKKSYVQNMDTNDTRPKFNSASEDGYKPKKEQEEVPEKQKEDKRKERVNRNARLVIRNVSFKATEDSLKEHFETYGDILEVKLLKKPDGKLVGCAFISFKNVPMAKKALLNTNMKPFLGRPISVDWAVAKNKYMQHVVSQQLEMEENIKKEESDSDDDDKPPLNVSNEDVKDEIKSESGSDDESDEEESGSESDDDKKVKKPVKSESDDDDDDNSDDDDDEGDEEDDDDDEEEGDEDIKEENDFDVKPDRQRIKLNDAEDGCTVFITNIPFSVDNDQLREFAQNIGPVNYALICVDKMTEHSKGSGFVKFTTKEHADAFLSLPADQLRLEGQVLLVKPALKRENLQKGTKKEAKDNRNLYLVKEGVVVAGTKAAVGLSASDMAKRLALERSKTQMLKNLNRFVSRYRLVVSNLPSHFDDAKLRRVCVAAGDKRAVVTECRVMRDLRTPTGPDGKHPSKGYGFVMFTRHEDALACLRKLNNNPDIFDKNNRPIVSFSIEDRTALNARKKRLEKSIANNPLAQKDGNTETQNNDRKNRKRKPEISPDESYAKRRKFGKLNKFNKNINQEFGQNREAGKFVQDRDSGKFGQNRDSGKFGQNRDAGKFGQNRDSGKFGQNRDAGKFVRKPRDNDYGEYTGLTAKEGSQHKMRSNHKLKAQADIHRQTVKSEKKQSGRAMRLKMAAKERVKQPKQKINKNPTKKRNKNRFRSKFDRLL